jgi:transposase
MIDTLTIVEEKGCDGKKTSGVKLCAAVDTNGLPHAVWVTAANAGGRGGAVEMMRKSAPNLSKAEKASCDGGYCGENFAAAVRMLTGAEVEAVKRNELHTFAVLPKRRAVERTFGGWKSFAGFGRTANERFITRYKWWFSRFYHCC